MPDHVHAILHGEADFRISPFMQVWKKTCSYRLARFYAAEISHYRKTWPPHSPTWQARFYDFHIESDEKLNEKIDYIHHNPVVAGLAATIVDWPWSSARFYQLSEPVGVTVTP